MSATPTRELFEHARITCVVLAGAAVQRLSGSTPCAAREQK